MSNLAWETIFDFYNIHDYDFNLEPFIITANQIKDATRQFKDNKDREPRLICKHDTRESRPQLFQDKNLFLLPIKNGIYAILRGEGYVDIPSIDTAPETYISQLDYDLDTVKVGDSEMQHIDYAYATSLIRSIMDDDSLVLVMRGLKYTPTFFINIENHNLSVDNVPIYLNTVYEGRNQIVIIQNIRPFTPNLPIQDLYFKFLMFQTLFEKPVKLLLAEYVLHEFGFWTIEGLTSTVEIPITNLSSSRWRIV